MYVSWYTCISVFQFHFAEFNYKNMTGSSQYKFGILTKIVKHLRVSVLFSGVVVLNLIIQSEMLLIVRLINNCKYSSTRNSSRYHNQ